MSDPQLDVRAEPPARRHGLIFEAYDRLAAGSGFVLVNDHDPKPLYYQFAAEHPDQFTWDYLEQGPEIWRVRIGRGLSAAATRVRAQRGDADELASVPGRRPPDGGRPDRCR